MKIHSLDLRLALLVCGAMLAASAAQAQATRTWVSGVGDDANPCSRTAPCKTFAGAISKTATNGEIDVLDPGGFGAINITKSITLDGTTGAGFGSILASATNGVIINAAGGTVRLRNLSINGTGGAGANGIIGIKILAAANVHIENVVIATFTNRGISDERNGAGKLFVSDTIVRNVAQSGIVVAPIAGTVTAMFDRVLSEGNNIGFAIGNGAKVTARNATAAGNVAAGFFADTAGTEFNLESCVSHANATGVLAAAPGTPTIRLSNCVITNNTSNGLQATGGSILSFQNNKLAGNAGNQGPITAANPGQQ